MISWVERDKGDPCQDKSEGKFVGGGFPHDTEMGREYSYISIIKCDYKGMKPNPFVKSKLGYSIFSRQ